LLPCTPSAIHNHHLTLCLLLLLLLSLLPMHHIFRCAKQMSLAKLAERPEDPYNAGYVAAACLLALAGLAVLILVRAAAPPGPARVMGILAAVIYGIIVSVS
jgi:hypothetical protein